MQNRKFFLVVLALENANQKQLDRFVTEVNALLSKYTNNGLVTDPRELLREMNKVIDNYYNTFVDLMYEASEKVAKIQVAEAIASTIPLLNSAGLYKEALALYKEVQGYAVDVRKRLFLDNWSGTPTGIRIKTIRTGTQKTVQNIVLNGVKEGDSAYNIAKKLRQYINPIPKLSSVSVYDEYRKRFGRVKGVTPNIRTGSVQYNSMRIARTEMSHIYRQATIDFYKDKNFNKGFEWRLSRSHPKRDSCDDNAKFYETAEEIPETHPNCLCTIVSIPLSREELKALFKEEPARVKQTV